MKSKSSNITMQIKKLRFSENYILINLQKNKRILSMHFQNSDVQYQLTRKRNAVNVKASFFYIRLFNSTTTFYQQRAKKIILHM
ncbi:hypothetical protein T10_4880 [Trichinella papuae]|uniref:Uncharacterized protein n=1 Tax=Trichinella papuae TaxID=268474 RepID=A0A0V1N0Y5_9BILA|nr:hypothetical protein T10_4880 [Trichinella papuae]